MKINKILLLAFAITILILSTVAVQAYVNEEAYLQIGETYEIYKNGEKYDINIVSIDENNIIQTKGDHNQAQLTASNNLYRTDETNINQDQLIGKAILRIPYLGWIKIWFVELIQMIFG